MVIGDLKDLPLGVVKQLKRIGTGLVGLAHQIGHGFDHLTEERFLRNDAGVIFDIGRRGDFGGELRQVVAAPNIVELLAPFQFVGERDKVHGVALLKQVEHSDIDFFVFAAIERIGGKHLNGFWDRLALKEHGPQHRLFNLGGLGRYASGFLVHGFVTSTPLIPVLASHLIEWIRRLAGSVGVDIEAGFIGRVVGHGAHRLVEAEPLL